MKLMLRAALALAALWAGSAPASAQVQMIIPWPAGGGGTHTLGRLIQPAFTEALETQVVIRNMGGATGTIGAAEVVRTKPDGQTILLTSMAPIAIQPSFMARAPYRAGNPIRYLNRQAFTAYVEAKANKYEGLIRSSGLQQAA